MVTLTEKTVKRDRRVVGFFGGGGVLFVNFAFCLDLLPCIYSVGRILVLSFYLCFKIRYKCLETPILFQTGSECLPTSLCVDTGMNVKEKL